MEELLNFSNKLDRYCPKSVFHTKDGDNQFCDTEAIIIPELIQVELI